MQQLSFKGWSLTLLLLPLLLVMGNRPNCDRREPTLTCETDTPVSVAPGECVVIDNPCDQDGDWAELDGFRLCDEPNGLFVRTRRRGVGRIRELCASLEIATLVNEPVKFLYSEQPRGRSRPELGEGVFLVTTGDPVVAVASATPVVIPVGGTTQLNVLVSGGDPPYTFLWSSDPPGAIALGDATLQNPVVTPALNTTFHVMVTDAIGVAGAGRVDVVVGLSLHASASPKTISVGETSQLAATIVGGVPPYLVSWVPIASLSNPISLDPVASPTETTMYTVTVDDSVGNHREDSVTVTVTVNNPACFTVTPDPPDVLGDTEIWDASCSSGTITGYWWEFDIAEYPDSPDACYGADTIIDWGLLWAKDVPCVEPRSYSQDIKLLPVAIEPPAGYTWQVTLWVTDGSNEYSTTKTYVPQ